MGPSPHPTETDLLVTQVFRRNAEQPPRFLALLEMLRMGLCHEHFRADGQCWSQGLGNHQFPSVFFLPLEGDQAHWCGLLRSALFLCRLLPVLRWIRKGGNYSRRSESSDRLCQVPALLSLRTLDPGANSTKLQGLVVLSYTAQPVPVCPLQENKCFQQCYPGLLL